MCRDLEASAKQRGVKLLLPTDMVVAQKFEADAPSKIVDAGAIEDGWMVRLFVQEEAAATCASHALMLVSTGPMACECMRMSVSA